MKKLLILALLIASVTFVFAVESDFSDVVGYVKLESSAVNTQFFTPIFDVTDVSYGDYFIDLPENTQIVDNSAGTSATCYSGVWYDDVSFETPIFESGHAYFISDETITEYYQYGKVFQGSIVVAIAGNDYTAFGLPIAENFGTDELNFIGSENSQLLNNSNGTSATCFDGVWYNDEDFSIYSFEAGCAYWINNTGAGTDLNLTVDYSGSRNNAIKTKKISK